MSLIEKLTQDMKTAMKAREKQRLGTIRLLIAALKNEQISKGNELSEEEGIAFLSSQAKRRRESIEAYNNAGRDELAAQEQAELDVIATYLPQQLSEAEVEVMLKEVIAQVGAQGRSDMGKVMGAIMPRLKGRFSGKSVRPMVDKLLA